MQPARGGHSDFTCTMIRSALLPRIFSFSLHLLHVFLMATTSDATVLKHFFALFSRIVLSGTVPD